MYRQTSKQKEMGTHRHTHPAIQNIHRHRQTDKGEQADRWTNTHE